MASDRRPRYRLVPTLIAVSALAASASLAAQDSVDPDLSRLEAEIERIASSGDGSVGIAISHLETGRTAYLNGTEPFPMASTYKVPIAVQLLTRVDHGELSLDQMIDIEPGDLHPGSGIISRLLDDPGVSLSVRNLLELMMLISDNSATDVCLRLAGGSEGVNARMAELGVEGLSVDRPTSLLIGDYRGVEGLPADGRVEPSEYAERSAAVPAPRRAEAAAAFADDPRDQSTPGAMLELLRTIWVGEALSPESTELLIDVMERVQTGAGRLKGALPPGTVVAHKTGTIGGTTNDVGTITLPQDAGHVIVAAFVKESDRPVADRERIIAQIARSAYDYFLFNPE